MKKVITILLVCVLCVSLFCACGKKDKDDVVDKKPVESMIPDEIVIPETTLMDPDDGKLHESPDHSPETSVKPAETKKPSDDSEETHKSDTDKKD